jgi:hypothetical protein
MRSSWNQKYHQTIKLKVTKCGHKHGREDLIVQGSLPYSLLQFIPLGRQRGPRRKQEMHDNLPHPTTQAPPLELVTRSTNRHVEIQRMLHQFSLVLFLSHFRYFRLPPCMGRAMTSGTLHQKINL